MDTACCFSGYRPQKFSFQLKKDDPQYIRFENQLLSAIFSMPQKDCYTFYSGAAMGFDLIAAELVLLLKKSLKGKGKNIQLICVVPFEDQAKKWPLEWQKRYNKVLNEADSVVVISKEYHSGCYHRRNKYMVDHSNYIITYYDGKSGGTRNTLKYAQKSGLTIINIFEQKHVSNFDGVVYILEKQNQKQQS
ncbi:MAG TPA: DUF1273 domain-containing protein [Clostridiales bacterium]|nr:DUF1273 domain-containing protein [Clostridiales bacterium]